MNMKDKILRSMHGDYCTVCKRRKSKHDVELESSKHKVGKLETK